MRIGGSFNLPQLPQPLPQRQGLPSTSALPTVADQQSSTAKATTAPQPTTDFSAEFARTRSSQTAGSDRFYSTDRQLSLKGQAAMETYVTNAGFQFGRSQAEWVGVDLYA